MRSAILVEIFDSGIAHVRIVAYQYEDYPKVLSHFAPAQPFAAEGSEIQANYKPFSLYLLSPPPPNYVGMPPWAPPKTTYAVLGNLVSSHDVGRETQG